MIPVRYNVRSLFVRKTTTLATLGGIALVVFILAAALMLSEGLQAAMQNSGPPGRAVVLRKGSDVEMSSSIDSKTVGLILSAPGVAKKNGQPVGAGEAFIVIAQEIVGTDGQVANVPVRGVTPDIFTLRPEIRLVEGRPAKPGTDEVIIGDGIAGRFVGMSIGETFELRKNRPLTVVGIFEANGSAFESEVLADLDTVTSSFGRQGAVSSVTVELVSVAQFDAFRDYLESDKRLGLEALRVPDYYERQAEMTHTFLVGVGLFVSIFFIAAAVIGAFITMNTAVARRKREVGTLLALGFPKRAILGSFVLESMLLTLLGAAVGIACASVLGNFEFSMMNFQSWSEISFSFSLSPSVAITSAVVGVGMGFFGGILPALRAAYLKPILAMRA